MFIISMEKLCLLIQVASAVITVANKSGLLPILAVLEIQHQLESLLSKGPIFLPNFDI